MAEILKEWLTRRLQRPIKWEAQEFGDMMKNGHVVASVLYSYHVINEEKLFLIRPSNLLIDIKSNWKYLTEWMRELEVYLNDQELNKIIEGKGSAILRLFYQLFLHLDKRDRTNFLKRERKMVSSLVEKMERRFKVEAVDEDEESTIDYLSKPLLNERHFIDWQIKKAEEVKDTYKYVRHRYKKIIERIEESKLPCFQDLPHVKPMTSKELKDMDDFSRRYPCKFQNYTYDELVKLEQGASAKTAKTKPFIDTDLAKSYMSDLCTRLHRESDSQEFQKQARSVLRNSMRDLTVVDEEQNVDLEFAKKVMKLSQLEKQMCTQIMETKQQARNLAIKRINAEKEYAAQRNQQFEQYLNDVKEQIHN